MSKRCKYTNAEVSLLGRLIRSEAVGEGNFGMMLVGNVVVNRVVARCLEFKRQKTITKVINAKNAFDNIRVVNRFWFNQLFIFFYYTING